MKSFLLLFLALPFLSYSQDCKFKKEQDNFTGTKLSSGFTALNEGKSRVLLSVDADAKEIDFFFALNQGGDALCFDDKATASVMFEGTKSKANFKNTGSMNCEGLFHFTFRNTTMTNSQLNRLGTVKVTSIEFTGNDGKKTVVSLTPEDQAKLMLLASCVAKEAKTLLP